MRLPASLKRPIAAAMLGAALFGATGAAQAACQPSSYCNTAGACLSFAQVEAQAEQRYGGEGYTVSRVRLRDNAHAPGETCLWFEVLLSHAERGQRVVYWNIDGGEAPSNVSN